MLRSYELVNMVLCTLQLVNCIQLTSQLVNTTCELEVFSKGSIFTTCEKMVVNGERLQDKVP